MPHALPERYQVLDALPRGRRGPVFHARDAATGREVLVRAPEPQDDVGCHELRNAIARARRVTHAGLVEVLAADIGERPWMVTPFLPHTAGDRRDLTWERVRDWMVGVLQTLGDLHARGLWHGDVRATNLREDGSGACWLSEPWAPAVPPPADQLGAGSVLWELVTGARPGIGTLPQFPVPEELGRVLGVLVHPDPLGRFASCSDAARALASLDGPVGEEPLLLPEADVLSPPRTRRPAPASLPRTAPTSRAHPATIPDERLWVELARVEDEGAPRVVCLLGDPVSLRSAVDALEEAVVADGLAEVTRLGWDDVPSDGDGAVGALVRDLPPGLEVRGNWLARVRAASGTVSERATVEGDTIARWVAGQRPGVGNLALEEVVRRVRAAAWRGRAVLVLDRVDRCHTPEEGWDLAMAFLDGTLSSPVTVPALVVLAVSSTALGRPEVVSRLDALTQAGAERIAVSAPVEPDAVTVAEDTVEVLAGPPPSKRERDAVHLAALLGDEVPMALLEGWSGPAWGVMELASGWTVRFPRVRFEPGERRRALDEAGKRPDRRYLHRRVAIALRAAARPLDAAHHAAIAGDTDLTAALCCDAAACAAASGRDAQLAEAARLGAELLAGPGAPAASAAGLELWVGTDLARRRDPEGLAHLGRARTRGSPAIAVRAAIRASEIAEASAADGLLGEAASAARASEDLALEQEATLARARAFLEAGSLGEADHWFGKALARATQRADLAGAAQALLGQVTLAQRSGRFSEAFELVDEVTDALRGGHDPMSELRCRVARAWIQFQTGRTEAARDLIGAGRCRAVEIGAPRLRASLDLLEAQLLAEQGRRDEALAALARIEEAAEAADDVDIGAEAAITRAVQLLAADDLDAAYDAERQAAARLERAPGHHLWGRYRLAVAVLLALRGDHTQTWQWLWSAQEQAVALGADLQVAWCLERLVSVAAERRWGNVLRLAGQLGVEQLDRLGQEERAQSLRDQVAAARG
ncbi:MAG: hypothetical protein H6735_05345 [Alphaproteobacteria bacterium]|nr:hypothetical protein [Alphaproteobacteria bacterium]